MMAVLDTQVTLPGWRDDDGSDTPVVVLDADREPSVCVLITQRGATWFWGVAEGDNVRANGTAVRYEDAAGAAGYWLKGRLN